jgi:NADH:ubiquinone oxidoreductase subunit K
MAPSAIIYSIILRPYITIVILTIRVVEARLGLRLLVIISRKHGSDIIKSLTINKC